MYSFVFKFCVTARARGKKWRSVSFENYSNAKIVNGPRSKGIAYAETPLLARLKVKFFVFLRESVIRACLHTREREEAVKKKSEKKVCIVFQKCAPWCKSRVQEKKQKKNDSDHWQRRKHRSESLGETLVRELFSFYFPFSRDFVLVRGFVLSVSLELSAPLVSFLYALVLFTHSKRSIRRTHSNTKKREKERERTRGFRAWDDGVWLFVFSRGENELRGFVVVVGF